MKKLVLMLVVVVLAAVIDLPETVKVWNYTFYRPKLPGRDLEIKLGLDLQGGTHLVYEASMSGIAVADRKGAIESAKTNIEKRINLLGVSEPVIQTAKVGEIYRLIVELPGVKDVNNAINIIGKTAQLEFLESKVATPSGLQDFTSTGLTGADLHLAQVQFGSGKTNTTSSTAVGLEFTPEGAKKFSDITAKNIGKPVAIMLDGQIVTAPTVQSVINDGKAVISGNFDIQQAKNLVIQLNAGALPVPIKIVEQRNVGATLGSQSITKSLIAAGVGLVVVWLFMFINYGFKGLLANFALVVYVILSLSIVKLIPITLTLAGIAGFVLSIGMAVDANILIFERIKEELNWGRPMSAALELGFLRAWSSIRDSNLSTLITAGILFWFGSGSVRGFALTLAVGVLVSMFTSISVTRNLLNVFYSSKTKV